MVGRSLFSVPRTPTMRFSAGSLRSLAWSSSAILVFGAGSLLAQQDPPRPAGPGPATQQVDGGFTFRWSSSTAADRNFRAQQYFVAKGHAGVQMLNLTEGLRTYFGVPTGVGVLIAEIQPGGPADRAGLRPGDVITEVDGTPAQFAADVLDRVGREGGNSLTFGVVRSKRSLTIKVPIELQQTRVVRLRPNLDSGESTPAQNEFVEMLSPTDLEFTMDQLRLFVGGDGLRRNVERLHEFDAKEFEAKIRALEEQLTALQEQLPESSAPGGGAPPRSPQGTEPTLPDR